MVIENAPEATHSTFHIQWDPEREQWYAWGLDGTVRFYRVGHSDWRNATGWPMAVPLCEAAEFMLDVARGL